jgi:hypothetical protein
MFIKPDYNLKNVYEINFEELKQQGVKCLMFDLDSTVMVSKSATFLPETLEWFNSFLNDFEVAIISNNNNDYGIWIVDGMTANGDIKSSGLWMPYTKNINSEGIYVHFQGSGLNNLSASGACHSACPYSGYGSRTLGYYKYTENRTTKFRATHAPQTLIATGAPVRCVKE